MKTPFGSRDRLRKKPVNIRQAVGGNFQVVSDRSPCKVVPVRLFGDVEAREDHRAIGDGRVVGYSDVLAGLGRRKGYDVIDKAAPCARGRVVRHAYGIRTNASDCSAARDEAPG